MIRHRCLTNYWGYCTGEPEPIKHTEPYSFKGAGGQMQSQEVTLYTCKLSPSTCGKFLGFNTTLSQELNSAVRV